MCRSADWRAYSIALRMSSGLAICFPSSEKATAPASKSSAKSVISFPSSPRLTAATGKTSADPSLRAFSRMYLVISGWSFTGWLFAIGRDRQPANCFRAVLANQWVGLAVFAGIALELAMKPVA